MTAAKTSRRSPRKGRPAAEAAELGEVRFEDWFETPIFETEPDERLEELTTARARPLRLAARALVRLDATKRRPAPRAPEQPEEGETFADLARLVGAEDRDDRPAAVGPPAPVTRRTRPLRADRPAVVTAEATPTAAPAVVPAAAPESRRPRPLRAARASEAPAATAPAQPAAPTAAEVADRPPSGWRARAGRALDAWAERELSAQARLEQVIVPKRWRA